MSLKTSCVGIQVPLLKCANLLKCQTDSLFLHFRFQILHYRSSNSPIIVCLLASVHKSPKKEASQHWVQPIRYCLDTASLLIFHNVYRTPMDDSCDVTVDPLFPSTYFLISDIYDFTKYLIHSVTSSTCKYVFHEFPRIIQTY